MLRWVAQGAINRLERWSEYRHLSLNPRKCEASFFSVDSYQANLQSHLFLSNSRLLFNPTPTFLVVTFDRSLSFSNYVFSLKTKFFPCLKVLCCISVSSWGPSLFCVKLFFGFLSLMLHPNGFLFLALSTLSNWNTFTERLVAPPLAASRLPLSVFSSQRRLYLHYKYPDSFLPVIL